MLGSNRTEVPRPGLLQRREGRLARAMAGRNVLCLEGILQHAHHFRDGIIRCDGKVKAAGDQPNFGNDGC
jgi:hypothetical protein